LTSKSFSLIVGLPGDFNSDGSIDAADYVVWRKTLGQNVAIGSGADGNRDGEVNELDFAVWKSYFGAVAVAGTGSVTPTIPEPATYLLVALATLKTTCARRRHRAVPQ
jgi:hypothetical protein